MVTLIAGTNRSNSKTAEIAAYYQKELFAQHGIESRLLDLASLPPEFISGHMYGKGPKHPSYHALMDTLAGTTHSVWLFPEYNNSFPGVMKSFLDSFPFPNPLKGTAAAMVGISAGTNGGANGMSHLADILSYLGVSVLPQRLRIYSIMENWKDGEITQPMLRSIMAEQQAALAASILPTVQHRAAPLVMNGDRS